MSALPNQASPMTVEATAHDLQAYPLAPGRAAGIAGELTAMLASLDLAAADLPFEAEPADMLRAMEELAPRP